MSVQLSEDASEAVSPVRAVLTVTVTRNGAGSLADGVRERLESTDGVDAVESFELGAIQPGLNDLTVGVDADLQMTAGSEDAAARLSEAFGVEVESVEVAASPRGPPDDRGQDR
ncbi:MAG: hypothetical protein ABEJ79_12050 [Halolamina sp.]